MRRSLLLAATVFLASCSAAPRDIALAGLDLGEPAVIAQISKDLPQRERAAFATYALLHWPESKAYCGRPMFKGADQPLTVGEAVDKTMHFETALARKRIEEKKQAPSIFERQAQEKKRLVDEFDQLTLERDMLASAAIPASEKDRRTRELDRKLAENRKARESLAAVPALMTGSAL